MLQGKKPLFGGDFMKMNTLTKEIAKVYGFKIPASYRDTYQNCKDEDEKKEMVNDNYYYYDDTNDKIDITYKNYEFKYVPLSQIFNDKFFENFYEQINYKT